MSTTPEVHYDANGGAILNLEVTEADDLLAPGTPVMAPCPWREDGPYPATVGYEYHEDSECYEVIFDRPTPSGISDGWAHVDSITVIESTKAA